MHGAGVARGGIIEHVCAVTVKLNGVPAVAVAGAAVITKCVACAACTAGARSTRRTGIASAAITRERALVNTGVARENFCISISTLLQSHPRVMRCGFPHCTPARATVESRFSDLFGSFRIFFEYWDEKTGLIKVTPSCRFGGPWKALICSALKGEFKNVNHPRRLPQMRMIYQPCSERPSALPAFHRLRRRLFSFWRSILKLTHFGQYQGFGH